MNVFTFDGRVGADAELRTTQSGEQVLSFRIANDIGFGDRRTTQWIDVSYWGKRAAAIASYVRKGDRIMVSGEVKLEEFQRRDGTPGSKLAVRANDVGLASKSDSAGGSGGDRDTGSSGGGSGGGQRSGGGSSGGGNKPPQNQKYQDLDDDIPF